MNSSKTINDKQNRSQRHCSSFHSERANDWCAGCGDFGILTSLEKALTQMQLQPEEVAVFGGIGCSGKTPYYLNSYGIHTLHGRVLPFATGAKLAKPSLVVIAVGGDGDGLSIGGNHLLHTGRRNVDLTYILFDNGVYGLTKGQASPTLRHGEQTKAMTSPNVMNHTNSLSLALAAGFTWIGRGYAYNVSQLCELMAQAIRHPGSSFLNVLQPCPTYNQLHDKDWFAGKDLENNSRLYSLQDEGFDPLVPAGATEAILEEKMSQCLSASLQWGNRIPTGIFYQDLSRPRLLDHFAQQRINKNSVSVAEQPICDHQGHSVMNLDRLFDKLSTGVTQSRSEDGK